MSTKKNSAAPGRRRSTKRILVVGDWVVDDYWVTGIHRSPTSSRTGRQHFRALHDPDSTVQSLGIAGRTASLLYRATVENEDFCEVACVGLWHRDDTETLGAMLEPTASKGQTPYRLIHPKSRRPQRVRLFNLGDALASKSKQAQGQESNLYGTTRVIRIYQNIGTKIDLIQRIDWELRPVSTNPPHKPQKVWVTDEATLDSEEFGLKNYLKDHKPDAVVVKDINKGVLSRELVRWLVRHVKDAKWFVSSKAWKPGWLRELKDVDMRLLLVTPVAAQRAVQEGALSCWMTRTGAVSQEAFAEFDELRGIFTKSQHLRVVALPGGLTLLAHDYSKRKPVSEELRTLVQTEAESLKLAVEVPMASVFFPALAARILRYDDGEDSDESTRLKELVQGAMKFTRFWMKAEVKRVEMPGDWDPAAEPRLDPSDKGGDPGFGNWRNFNWGWAQDRWRLAFKDLGVVKKQNSEQRYLELWRAMTEVDGYVCCVETRRRILREIVRELRSFVAGGRQHHKSFMLIASPGSGKTYLVSCLAKALGMHILPFNITQMASRDDLFDCFDTIITTQQQNPARPILVFVDEMNARLDGQLVYGTFLAPIQEGSYVKAGKTFHIAPCAWIFAGTQHPKEEDGDNRQHKSDKGSDFASRLTLPVQDLRHLEPSERAQEATERVYLGASLIRHVFPDVLKVSEKVLRLFHELPKDIEGREIAAREIEHFVKSFVHVQYGEVNSKNIPHKDERFKKYLPGDWSDPDEGDGVEIKMIS